MSATETLTAFTALVVGQPVTFKGRASTVTGAGRIRTNELTGERYQIVTVANGTGAWMIGSSHSELVR